MADAAAAAAAFAATGLHVERGFFSAEEAAGFARAFDESVDAALAAKGTTLAALDAGRTSIRDGIDKATEGVPRIQKAFRTMEADPPSAAAPPLPLSHRHSSAATPP